jgi:hypothetical protein
VCHSDPSETTDAPPVNDEMLRLTNKPTPPWVALIVGFLFLDGLFGGIALLLTFPWRSRFPYTLPPFSFVRWYAYEESWLYLGYYVRSLLHWVTPFLEMVIAWKIWRAPGRTQQLVCIVGAALALGAALNALLPSHYVNRGYAWPLGRTIVGLADFTLAVFAIWFVRRFTRLSRPEVTLLSVFLVLMGIGLLGTAIGRMYHEGFWTLFSHPITYRPWTYVTVQRSIMEVLSSSLLIIGGLLLMRRRNPVRAAAMLMVVTSVSILGMWLYRVASWGQILSDLVYYWTQLCPFVGRVVIAMALVGFARRYVDPFIEGGLLCRTCRYNLTGNISGVCPECGTAVTTV